MTYLLMIFRTEILSRWFSWINFILKFINKTVAVPKTISIKTWFFFIFVKFYEFQTRGWHISAKFFELKLLQVIFLNKQLFKDMNKTVAVRKNIFSINTRFFYFCQIFRISNSCLTYPRNVFRTEISSKLFFWINIYF